MIDLLKWDRGAPTTEWGPTEWGLTKIGTHTLFWCQLRLGKTNFKLIQNVHAS